MTHPVSDITSFPLYFFILPLNMFLGTIFTLITHLLITNAHDCNYELNSSAEKYIYYGHEKTVDLSTTEKLVMSMD